MTATTTELRQLVADAFRMKLATRTISPRARNLLDHFYGPYHQQARADIASVILGRKIVKSGKEAQWGNWHKLIIQSVGAVGGCIAEREQNAAELIWDEILGE